MSSPSPAAKRQRSRRTLPFRSSRKTLSDVAAVLVTAVSEMAANPSTAADLRRLRDKLRMAATIAHSLYASQIRIEQEKQRFLGVLTSVGICNSLLSGATTRDVAQSFELTPQAVGARCRSILLMIGERLHRARRIPSPRLSTLPFSAANMMNAEERALLVSALDCLHAEYTALLQGTPAQTAFDDAWAPVRVAKSVHIA